jgi:hypothetical protein
MWTLSGFIDEISDDFSVQCKIASGLGLRHVEVRSAWDPTSSTSTPVN